MSATDTLYTARFQTDDYVEQGRDNVLKCPVYRSNAVVSPNALTPGTFTLYDANGTALIDAQNVTLSGSIAQYTVPSATVASSSRGKGWRVKWVLLMADGTVHTFENDAALVRSRLYPVVTDLDLQRRHSDLNPSATDHIIPTGTSLQDKVDEAWVEIDALLVAAGNRPNLIMSPASLREVHLYKSLELAFRDLSTSMGDGSKYADLAKVYEDKFTAAWGRLSFTYDESQTGQAGVHKRPARSVTFLGTAGDLDRGYGYDPDRSMP